jgi:hypothetical protein
MSFVDPASLDLKELFRDAAMFNSRGSWGAAGFEVFNRSSNGKIMVARHPEVEGLLFKKYTRDLSQKDQLKNFERRADGAVRLRSLVDKQELRHIIIPRKWILELPRAVFRKATSHVLVVEQLDLLNDDQTKAAYRRISSEILTELCVVLFHFRGMDSIAKNIPFVSDGRIGFIDTEHWDRSTSKPYLHRVGEYLSTDRRKLSKKIFEQLENGARVDIRDFSGDFANEEDTSGSGSDSDSDSRDDFDDEEDTKSSS